MPDVIFMHAQQSHPQLRLHTPHACSKASCCTCGAGGPALAEKLIDVYFAMFGLLMRGASEADNKDEPQPATTGNAKATVTAKGKSKGKERGKGKGKGRGKKAPAGKPGKDEDGADEPAQVSRLVAVASCMGW